MTTQTATALMAEAFHLPKSANTGSESGPAPVAQTDTAESTAIEVKPSKTKAVKKAAKAPANAKSESTAETKTKRPKKPKVVRDSFTMPKQDYDKIQALKQKCLDAGVAVKKSELLRAGLIMLEAAAPKRLLAAVAAVETVKTGRPSKS